MFIQYSCFDQVSNEQQCNTLYHLTTGTLAIIIIDTIIDVAIGNCLVVPLVCFQGMTVLRIRDDNVHIASVTVMIHDRLRIQYSCFDQVSNEQQCNTLYRLWSFR